MELPIEKKCKKCGQIKGIGYFYRDQTTSDGKRGKCIKCCNEQTKEWAKNKPGYFTERRHRLGVSIRYASEYMHGLSKTREYKRAIKIKRRLLGGELSCKTIQTVYEDNIKRFGTLTCYLCLQPIEFGLDSIQHRVPIARGGTYEYSNLSIACRSCNSRKHTRTDVEYLQIIGRR